MALLNQKISERHARSLLTVDSNELQKELLEKILLNRLTVRQLDEEIMRLTGKIVEDEEMTINEMPKVETTAPVVEEKLIINEEPTEKVKKEEIKVEIPSINPNIFSNLRVDEKETQENTPTLTEKPTIEINENNFNNIYDLRFAINNVRQAVQNTEKFGFSIETEEFDFENIYQIIIKIDKNK